ncbi:sensor histidine kinase [Nucisporomicrobium flavum]|uniref:sensor histidine kinase n=1 Tax=Nucisporomicrobium flavum TaxID=2785915 RepID=UPI0018F2969E|nr:ATP-binding protein [Nucisporomicrobium flavum]
MADRRGSRASVRMRTTAVAVVVVGIALLAGGVTLVALVRHSLRDAAESAAEGRVAALAAQIEAGGLPVAEPADGEDDDEPGDVVWQVTDAGGAVVRSSRPLAGPLPVRGTGEARLAGADHLYVVVAEDVTAGGRAYRVAAGASLEEVDASSAALVTPLAAGLPLVLLLVGATTWTVVGRALAPVERIRREVEEITGDRLDRRVPEPPSRDEIGRMARTMNGMLGRLQAARDRQRQFVADASHELRSPLAGIRQAAEVAHAHPRAMPEGKLAETVLEESARMQRLVEQMLLLTRADEGAAVRVRRDVDVDDLALAEARRVTRPGLTVGTSGIGGGRVSGDPAALAQVVRNLVDNAARHADSRIAVAVRRTGGTVELTVEDDGAGIPPEHREQVFERFVRLDEARARDAGGSGLGLAIVREIVAAHGGTVAVSDAKLGGARLTVRLPGG